MLLSDTNVQTKQVTLIEGALLQIFVYPAVKTDTVVHACLSEGGFS